jgi:hypothetical protein
VEIINAFMSILFYVIVISFLFLHRFFMATHFAKSKNFFIDALKKKNFFKMISIYSLMIYVFFQALVCLRFSYHGMAFLHIITGILLNVYANSPRLLEAACLIVDNNLTIENLKKRFYMTEYQANVTIERFLENGAIRECNGAFRTDIEFSGNASIEWFKENINLILNFPGREK